MTDLGLRVSVDDGIAELTLDRPPLNVFDMALLHAFSDAIDDLGSQRDLRLLVIRGKGKAFSAGVDVGEHLGDDLAPMLEAFGRAAMRLLASETPTLAIGHGAILGGACELIALADLAMVTDDAVMGTPESALRLARRTMRGAMRMPLHQAISEATDLQVRSIPEMADAQEGLRSFLEKRAPVWSHK